MSSRSRGVNSSLSLRDFIWRSKVLSQFRSFLRALRPLDAATRGEARVRVRAGFSAARNAGKDVRATILADGEAQLAVLRKTAALAERGAASASSGTASSASCGSVGHVHSSACASAGAGTGLATDYPGAGGRAAVGAPTINVNDTSGSWVGSGTSDDERGRTGSGWPWQ